MVLKVWIPSDLKFMINFECHVFTLKFKAWHKLFITRVNSIWPLIKSINDQSNILPLHRKILELSYKVVIIGGNSTWSQMHGTNYVLSLEYNGHVIILVLPMSKKRLG